MERTIFLGGTGSTGECHGCNLDGCVLDENWISTFGFHYNMVRNETCLVGFGHFFTNEYSDIAIAEYCRNYNEIHYRFPDKVKITQKELRFFVSSLRELFYSNHPVDIEIVVYAKMEADGDFCMWQPEIILSFYSR